MVLRRRDIVPFLVGFAIAFLLTSFKVSLNDIDTLNGSNISSQKSSIDLSKERVLNERSNDDHGSLFASSTSLSHSAPRKQVKAVIGIQTGFTTDFSDKKYDYTIRRKALRNSWFPKSQKALDTLEQMHGIVLRFVIGHSADPEAESQLAAEDAKHGGFIRLPIQEGYLNLANKTLEFYRYVAQMYQAEYIWKVDDDVFFRIDRVPAVMQQWKNEKADYIGCMKNGPVYASPEFRWYEPSHALLGPDYFTHCWGSAYVLSGKAVDAVVNIPRGMLRFLANEDVTVGSWMLALDMVHFDDRRLCATECNEWNVILFDMPQCTGLCDPKVRLEELEAAEECHGVSEDGNVPMVMPAIDFRKP